VEAAVAADVLERAGRVRSTAEVGKDLAARIAG
jgi:3-isopropylmalate dehydrogenase